MFKSDLKNSIANAIGWPVSSVSGVSASISTDSVTDQAYRGYQKNMHAAVQSALMQSAHKVSNDVGTVSSEPWRLAAINMRLRNNSITTPRGLDDLKTSYCGDKVFVFIVVKGKAVTLEDDAGMFPSDTLVTQIRLLQE